jgi:hypothetical protein
VLDIDLDVRISGVIRLGAGADRQRLRIEQEPKGVMRADRAAFAEIGEDVGAERQAVRSEHQDERLIPYSGGSGAGNEVRQLDAYGRPADHDIQSPRTSHGQQEAAEPSTHNELAEAERLLKSLASALALRLLSQAATKTRQAIAEAKRAMKGKDPQPYAAGKRPPEGSRYAARWGYPARQHRQRDGRGALRGFPRTNRRGS